MSTTPKTPNLGTASSAIDFTQVIAAMSESELRAMLDGAYKDLIDAATLCPNSEWHEACFSATYHLAEEMNRRGLTAKAVGVVQ